MIRKMGFGALLMSAILLPMTLLAGQAEKKPPITLDEFFNSVSYDAVQISPTGNEVVLVTDRADWKANRFRTDLWLYRGNGTTGKLVALTQSGHDGRPEWSPDGRWIAFLSDRGPAVETGEAAATGESEKKPVEQVYVISPTGGEAFPVTWGKEAVHAFAWSADSRRIYFATKKPLTKEQEEAQKKEWKDVIRYREQERGDVIYSIDLAAARAWNDAAQAGKAPEAKTIAGIDLRVSQIACSPNGEWLAYRSNSRSLRWETLKAYGIYLVGLTAQNRTAKPVNLLGNTNAIFDSFSWSRDNRKIFLTFLYGSIEGPYADRQSRVYSVDVAANLARRRSAPESVGPYTRWGGKFFGAITSYAVTTSDTLLAAGRLGTEVQPYVQSAPAAEFSKQAGWAGTYEKFSTAAHSPRIAFVYSAQTRPAEVYVAAGPGEIAEAHPITAFNKLFTERALPKAKPFRWTADDGTPVEGMLIYPPGKFEMKHLPMFMLIHGGPEDADGNHFEMDWYQWADLAATDGWLVFEPNYRGSIGYGDKFVLDMVPQIVSRPGKDILEGVDALVKAGIVDPNNMTIGGYSYGGYMTNWLITQTTRFKAAVTGAGAVEHVANWGNDDMTLDDAYVLGGRPWETEANYNAEAAIWQINKVKTPTHMVAGGADIRVYVGEDYLLERALHSLGIPSSLLIFPGEGHGLGNNPWHGKIKVRQELKWLDKYDKR
jgi:dipeptidyl aminopeptidase/acylaminoacyl peptidase